MILKYKGFEFTQEFEEDIYSLHGIEIRGYIDRGVTSLVWKNTYGDYDMRIDYDNHNMIIKNRDDNQEALSETKDMGISDSKGAKANISDLEVFGDPDTWLLISKASSQSQGWMKSTKAMKIQGAGVIVQVTTQQGDNVAESLQFVPNVSIYEDTKTGIRTIR